MLTHEYRVLSRENSIIMERQHEILDLLDPAEPPFWNSQSGLITIGALITFISFLAFAFVLYGLYYCDRRSRHITLQSYPTTRPQNFVSPTFDLPPPYDSV